MLSSEGSQIDTVTTRQQMITSLQTHLPPGTDHEQVFLIMDSVLSFEVCLYHQIVPLGVEADNMLIGMVHPEDEDALDYTGRILSYMQLKMVIQLITDESHRATMSAYLNYKNAFPFSIKKHPSLEKLFTKNPGVNITKDPPDTQVLENTQIYQHNTAIGTPIAEIAEINPGETIAHSPNLFSIPEIDSTFSTLSNPNCLIPLRITSEADVSSMVEIPKVFSPVEVLANLPAKKLLEELLGRILAGGIGRLYLERQSEQGRILWSDNGVLQSVLDKLPLVTFQQVMDELKQITSLPNNNATEVQQKEKEFLYQQKRLLLRLRVMPGTYGQEATLQVLRGAALKFYQQQKLTHLSRNTLETVQQLSRMLRELQERLLLDANPNSEQLEAINNLNQLMERVDQQTKILTAQSLPPENN